MSANELWENGYTVLESVFNQAEIDAFRKVTFSAINMMGKTRAAGHSYHLAGFHKYSYFAKCHADLMSNQKINGFLDDYFHHKTFYAIGLSDITINRSQQWHTDLLRGKYSSLLKQETLWNPGSAGCIKALVYLQSGKSLRIVPKSHLQPSPLDDAELDERARAAEHYQVNVKAGDVVMMDIRALHRGSTDEEMASPELANNPKILLSTVFGELNSDFAQAMELGNVQRMIDWEKRHLAGT